ncbi:MAG: hypothetical protein HYV02_07065 [Deltaproteobacteria bacterium]|nr:hypothetical protein [Deltaproteobacteria bacterium]
MKTELVHNGPPRGVAAREMGRHVARLGVSTAAVAAQPGLLTEFVRSEPKVLAALRQDRQLAGIGDCHTEAELELRLAELVGRGPPSLWQWLDEEEGIAEPVFMSSAFLGLMIAVVTDSPIPLVIGLGWLPTLLGIVKAGQWLWFKRSINVQLSRVVSAYNTLDNALEALAEPAELSELFVRHPTIGDGFLIDFLPRTLAGGLTALRARETSLALSLAQLEADAERIPSLRVSEELRTEAQRENALAHDTTTAILADIRAEGIAPVERLIAELPRIQVAWGTLRDEILAEASDTSLAKAMIERALAASGRALDSVELLEATRQRFRDRVDEFVTVMDTAAAMVYGHQRLLAEADTVSATLTRALSPTTSAD